MTRSGLVHVLYRSTSTPFELVPPEGHVLATRQISAAAAAGLLRDGQQSASRSAGVSGGRAGGERTSRPCPSVDLEEIGVRVANTHRMCPRLRGSDISLATSNKRGRRPLSPSPPRGALPTDPLVNEDGDLPTRGDGKDLTSGFGGADPAVAEILEDYARNAELSRPALHEERLAGADPAGNEIPHRQGPERAALEQFGVLAEPCLDGVVAGDVVERERRLDEVEQSLALADPILLDRAEPAAGPPGRSRCSSAIAERAPTGQRSGAPPGSDRHVDRAACRELRGGDPRIDHAFCFVGQGDAGRRVRILGTSSLSREALRWQHGHDVGMGHSLIVGHPITLTVLAANGRRDGGIASGTRTPQSRITAGVSGLPRPARA